MQKEVVEGFFWSRAIFPVRVHAFLLALVEGLQRGNSLLDTDVFLWLSYKITARADSVLFVGRHDFNSLEYDNKKSLA